MISIARKIETAAARELSALTPGLQWFPTKGDAAIDPPYVVVIVEEAEDQATAVLSKVYIATVKFVLVTIAVETGSDAHDALLTKVENALDQFTLQMPGVAIPEEITFNGMTVGSLESADEDYRHADVINATIGCSVNSYGPNVPSRVNSYPPFSGLTGSLTIDVAASTVVLDSQTWPSAPRYVLANVSKPTSAEANIFATEVSALTTATGFTMELSFAPLVPGYRLNYLAVL